MTVTLERITEVLSTVTPDIISKTPRRVYVSIPRSDLTRTISIIASELGVQHLSTITALDTGNAFEVMYHFLVDGIVVTVRTTTPRDDPTLDSIVSIFPGAVLYEREFHDLLGIVPNGHPDLRRLVLPEDWVGGYPLRKDWKPAEGED
ncbi:MAG TPA: NADH-quinone oxidoreductase subunit C [Candidatus Thermoplasmatota archaeon]|nr:NADH-quinone oxidoreductase subunit C [Candidatus Thermoplasmatota archaeon]